MKGRVIATHRVEGAMTACLVVCLFFLFSGGGWRVEEGFVHTNPGDGRGSDQAPGVFDVFIFILVLVRTG